MKHRLAALLVIFPSVPVQAADPLPPGASTILQQMPALTLPAPMPGRGTRLTIEKQEDAKHPASESFEVKGIRILGNTLFDTATLHALVADAEAKHLTLSQLDELAARIGYYYHNRGYPLVRAVTPAQIIQSGIVRIVVIEARYGKVGIDNSTRVNDLLLQATMAPLQSGQIIGQPALDQSLLLLSDIPGVVVNATLKPGEAEGTSDLMVNATPSPTVTGNVLLDDYGNSYTGQARASATVHVGNPLNHGDVLSLSGLSSGSGLSYGRIAYESLLNGHGTRLGGSYSALDYSLGGALASLDAKGSAQVESLWAKHPFLRSRDLNLFGQIQYDQTQLREHIDTSGTRTDRHLANWTLGLAGDARDALLSGGINTWNLSLTTGRVDFDDDAAQLVDAATARTQGEFSKLNLNLARLQGLGPRSALYLSFSGQWANVNLDASQKMTVGGPYSVRAYEVGAVSGDTGYRGTIEFRYDLGQALRGRLQAVAFIDSAHVTVNKFPWTTGTNSTTLSGVGMGLNWTGPNQWSARTYIAVPVGPTPELGNVTDSARAWTEVGWRF